MPFLLRKITKPKWLKEMWLATGKAPANALGDLRSEENKISFWHIEDNKSNLTKVVAALASGRDFPTIFDYALIDQTLLTTIGIKIDHTVGNSFHKEADKYWHHNTIELSAENVAKIADIIMEHGTKERIGKNEVTSLVRQEITAGAIDVNPLKDRLKEKDLPNWLE